MKKIVILSLLMVPVIFSQNTVTKVVDPGGKGDFTSLQAWALWVYTQTAGNLVASNVTEIARCICTNGQADTQPISGDASFVAFTTDATHYIKIYADTNYNGVNYRNRGVYPAEGSNIYRLECLSKNTPVLGITTSKVIIDGICIENILPDSSYSGNCIQLADCDQGGYVTNCILLDNKTSIAGDVLSDEHGHGIRIDAAYRYSKYYIHNNIIIGFRDVNPAAPPNCGILIYPTTDSAVAWIDNNTIFDCEYGVWNRGGMSGYDSCRVTLRNNIFQDTAADWHSQSIMGIQYTSASSNNVYLPYCTPLGVIPITNNGFEDTTSVEPFVNGDVASESYPGSPVHTGMHSLEVSAGWNSIDIYTASITGLQANTVYSLSFYDEHGWGNGFNVSVKSASYSSSTLGSYLTSASDSIMTNHTIVFNSGNNTSVIIDINGGSGGGAYYFDDFFMYPGSDNAVLNNNAYFKDISNNDFHLINTASLAIGQGINLSLDPNDPFSSDIAGNIRVTPWDAGAFKFNAGNNIDTPGVTLLVSPNGSSVIPDTASSIIFIWKSASYANAYELQIANDLNFNTIIMDTSGIIDTAFTYHSNKLSSTFYWRVRGNNTAGTGSWSAVMKVSLITRINNIKNIMPAVYNLYQNYPNPFNPATLIKFDLPFSSNVKIEVYNILGEKVKELLNELKPAGYYEVNFNTIGLSSGVYLYMIEAKSLDGKSEYINTKKMMLLK